MPGTSARLFDVKRAIVRAKKLDKSTGGPQLEFDLSVKNAMTQEAYDDETMLLPRGSRLIVQRLPAARGHDLLSKIARADAGISNGVGHVAYGNVAAAQNGFYTIESHKGEQDEFVDVRPTVPEPSETNIPEAGHDSEKELAALKAVTDIGSYGSSTTISRSAQPGKFRSGAGGVPLPSMVSPPFKPHNNNNFHSRPNADPELRDQERTQERHNPSQAPKKRATGIPRTFLNLTKQPAPDADGAGDSEDGDDGAMVNSLGRLQPNVIGFKALVNRGGGLSESGVGGKRLDLDYALKITNKTIPDHLQCGICHQIAKNAMFISWDNEGRSACELCMRDGLAQNGFRCPLTGNEGVSPDDLFPNRGLRVAADLFEQDVMKCMREIVERQEAVNEQEERIATSKGQNEFEGDSMDKGMIMPRKNSVPEKKRRNSNDFAEDDFGGDVFDVSNDIVTNEHETDTFGSKTGGDKAVATKLSKNENKNDIVSNNSNKSIAELAHDSKKSVLDPGHVNSGTDTGMTNDQSKNVVNSSTFLPKTLNKNAVDKSVPSANNLTESQKESLQTKQPPPSTTTNRREMLKNRVPPAGYTMGIAGLVHGPVACLVPPKHLSVSSHTDTISVGSTICGGRGRGGQGGYHHHQGGRGEDMHRNAFDNQGVGGFHGRGRGGGRFQGQKPPFLQQRDGSSGGGRGYRGGFGQTNYQNCGGRVGQQGWRGDCNGRGNHNGGNGDYLNNQVSFLSVIPSYQRVRSPYVYHDNNSSQLEFQVL